MDDQSVWKSDDLAHHLVFTAVSALMIGMSIGAAIGGVLGAFVL